VKLVGLQWIRALCGTLIICFTPLLSAAVGDFYGPGYYLPPGQGNTIAYPPWSVNTQSLFYHQSGSRSSPKFVYKKAANSWAQQKLQDYRFRPLQYVQANKTQSWSYRSDRYMAGFRPYPAKERRLSHSRVKPWRASKPNWRMAEFNRPYPDSGWEARDNGYQGALGKWPDFKYYKFRPVSALNSGVMTAQIREYSSIPEMAKYRYRPIDAISQPILAAQIEPWFSEQYARDDSFSYRASQWQGYATAKSGLQANRQEYHHRQFNAPVSNAYPGADMNSEGVYRFQPVPVYLTYSHQHEFPRHPYRYLDQYPQTLYAPPHPHQLHNYVYPRDVIMASSDLVPYNGSPRYAQNGYQQSTVMENAVESDWNDGRSGASSEVSYSDYWPQVSQYDLDEPTMIDYENKNF
jgi:hypothetical protein